MSSQIEYVYAIQADAKPSSGQVHATLVTLKSAYTVIFNSCITYAEFMAQAAEQRAHIKPSGGQAVLQPCDKIAQHVGTSNLDIELTDNLLVTAIEHQLKLAGGVELSIAHLPQFHRHNHHQHGRMLELEQLEWTTPDREERTCYLYITQMSFQDQTVPLFQKSVQVERATLDKQQAATTK